MLVSLVIIFALTVFCIWPRPDARFTGKWQAFQGNATTSVAVLDLRRDGTGQTNFSDGSPPDEYFWSGTSRHFTTSLKAQPTFTRLLAQIIKPLWFSLTGRELYFGSRLVLVKSVSRDEIKLESPDGAVLTYRRVSE